ncbi:rust resistance kinase Lr10-like, partial [Fagus crenata]
MSDFQDSCTFISMALAAYEDVKYPSYETILKMLESGFDLGWSVECRDCLLAGVHCLYSYDTPQLYQCEEPGNLLSMVLAISFSVFWSILLVFILIARFVLAPLVITVFLIHKFITTQKMIDNKEEVVQCQMLPK